MSAISASTTIPTPGIASPRNPKNTSANTTIMNGTVSATSITQRTKENSAVSARFFRVMANVGGFHRTIDDYLIALGARFGEAVTPEHVVR